MATDYYYCYYYYYHYYYYYYYYDYYCYYYSCRVCITSRLFDARQSVLVLLSSSLGLCFGRPSGPKLS